MATTDYYRILGVSPEASAEEIKKRYRELAFKYHPDRNNGDPEREERLKEITQAYHVLGDEDRRRRYDLMNRGPGHYGFGQVATEDDLIDVLWHLYQTAGQRGFGRCRGMGFGKRGCGCGRWGR